MRFVASVEAVRKYLKNGIDWIEIKKELNVGEDRRYRTAGMTKMRTEKIGDAEATPTIDVDFAHMAVARVEAYLVDWSDKRKINRAAIEALCKEDFEEIDGIIQAHIDEMEKEKKDPNGQSADQRTPTS